MPGYRVETAPEWIAGSCDYGVRFAAAGASAIVYTDIERDGILGAITGRALYEGTLDLAAAQALCDA